MDQASKLGVGRIIQVAVPIVSVTIAAIALLTTVAARKKELTVTYLGSDKLVSVDAGGLQPGLRVEYEGQPVSSLLKMNFVLRNTGATAIKGEDIKEPLALAFSKEISLLNAVLERTNPSEFTFRIAINKEQRLVSTIFLSSILGMRLISQSTCTTAAHGHLN
jgi:hypothetical protein